MAVSLLIITLQVTSILGSNIVYYKFSSSFGQSFYDYSGNKNHGQNGETLSSDTTDTIATSRGAYFSDDKNCHIKLPPNDVNPTPITLGSIFSIVMWFKSKDDNDYNLIYRILDNSNYFRIVRIDGSNYLKVNIVRGSYNSGDKKSQVTELFINGNNKIDEWVYVVMINDGVESKYYAKDILALSVIQPSIYSESGIYNQYIGYTSQSFEGFVWSFYLYNETITVNNFYSASYSGTNCLVSTCPSSCTPAVKENDIVYCISESSATTCSSCSNGCIGSVCLDCNNCPSKTCEIVSGIVKCYCIELTSSTCSCGSGYYLTSGVYCEKCYGECSSCSEALKCLYCKDANAEIHNSIGCTCKAGFYNTTALVNSGTCLACYSECQSCTQALKCLYCKDSNAQTHSTIGCTCKTGFYNTTALVNSGICLECYSECQSCTQALKCSFCKDSNADVHITIGCTCKTGFYNTTALLNSGTCLQCYSECQSCDQASKCLFCKDSNAQTHGTIGCTCKTGFYNTTALVNSGTCLQCYSECQSCDQALKCLFCKDSNAQTHASIGCTCKTGFYNTTALLNSGTCLECHSDCQSCTQAFKCSLCKDSHSTVHASVGCECNPKYYNLTSLSQDGQCLPCYTSCKTCNHDKKCLSCDDLNAKPDAEKGCICKDGFYNLTALENGGICLACHPNCRTCNQNLKCLTCIDSYAEVHSAVGCTCLAGFYNTTNLNNNGSCLACFKECKTCSSQFICDQCADSHSKPATTGGCLCESQYFNVSQATSEGICQACNNECKTCSQSLLCLSCLDANSQPSMTQGCECKTRYNKDSAGVCQVCHFDCESCSAYQVCSKCFDLNAVPNANQCECSSGFFNSSTSIQLQCSLCPANCSACENSEKCTSCKYKNMQIMNGSCECPQNFYFFNEECKEPCPERSYFLNGSCESCPDLCIECNSTCQRCVEDSSLHSNNSCECNLGFEKSGISCIQTYFEASLEVVSIRSAIIKFSEPLNQTLVEENFVFTVLNRTDLLVYLLKSVGNIEFSFSLGFNNAVDNGTEIEVNIIPGVIYSASGSMLKNHILSGLLPSYSPITINPSIQALLNSTTAMAQAAVSSSIGAAMMSNPAAAWALLNSIQILILLPLNSNNMTTVVKAFLSGFSGYNLLPNVLEYIFDSKATSEPYLEARRYGIETSVLFLNTGKSLSIFLGTVLLYPLVLALSKCKKGKITAKAIKMLGNYKYSFFLRFWTQTCLELMVFGLIQLRSVFYN